MSILSILLFESPRGPLYKSLISSGLSKSFVSNPGYQSDFSETHFTIGVSGISENQTFEIEKIINETLLDVSVNGFPKMDIEALLNRMDLKLKTVKSYNFMFSLQ
jgi:Zn-dependent M16 (insulinase) family peptidase